MGQAANNMETMTVPVLLREVRKAITAQNYAQAALLYTELMARKEMTDNFDIQVRHAYCVEKTGHINQAIALYKGVVTHYRAADETGAAESVEKTIAELEKKVAEERAAAKAEAERIKAEKVSKAQAEIERLRLEKEREEKLRLEREKAEKIRLEKAREKELLLEKARREQEAREKILREEQARNDEIRKKKEEAEKARAERFKSKKSKPAATTSNLLDTVQIEAIDLSDGVSDDEEEETYEIDLPDSEEPEPDQPNKPWLG